MLTNPPVKFPRRRRRARPRHQSPPVAPLTLVSALLDFEGDPSVRLTFDRAIDLTALDAAQFMVDDGLASGEGPASYVGLGIGDVPSPDQVVLLLEETGPIPPGPTLMTATGATGIVAADNGGTWPGVTDLELPFP